MSDGGLAAALHDALNEAERLGAARPATDAIRSRLAEPLRVAIAGRVKAGKSTLLNALVGERLAPTDAGECTRIVTWYRRGTGYQVTAELRDGNRQPLAFSREGGPLRVDLGSLPPEHVHRIVVEWPSRRLADVTLIDTPGLGAVAGDAGARTADLISGGEEVDAVVYLMRHLHRDDAGFLEAFADRAMGDPSPVNALAVLSRADEIGAGGLDAMEQAAAIAQRYAADDRLRSLVAGVVPVAGLMAETGRTLVETEAADLRALAALDPGTIEALSLSVDRFSAIASPAVPAERRRHLLDRLGLFGVRYSLQEIARGKGDSASDQASRLVAISGIDGVAAALEAHFGRRSETLKARSALRALRSLSADLRDSDPAAAAGLASTVERIEAGAIELVELRLAYLAATGDAELSPPERDEVELLTSGRSSRELLGLGEDEPAEAVRAGILSAVERWRLRAGHPLNAPATAEACDLAARCYESRYAGLAAG